jgi:hypothetical protein
MKVLRIQAGDYEISHAGHSYRVYSFPSAYGDVQWMVDRDDQACWAQCDTLRQAKQTISPDESEA